VMQDTTRISEEFNLCSTVHEHNLAISYKATITHCAYRVSMMDESTSCSLTIMRSRTVDVSGCLVKPSLTADVQDLAAHSLHTAASCVFLWQLHQWLH
jgi:hypothetical protein